jgi:hypothetical protein
MKRWFTITTNSTNNNALKSDDLKLPSGKTKNHKSGPLKMNCYAYPIIFDALKKNNKLYLSICLYDSVITIIKNYDRILIKKNGKKYVYNKFNFNFYSNKPIEKITIVHDTYGNNYDNVFIKKYVHAAVTIQEAWKMYKYGRFIF